MHPFRPVLCGASPSHPVHRHSMALPARWVTSETADGDAVRFRLAAVVYWTMDNLNNLTVGLDSGRTLQFSVPHSQGVAAWLYDYSQGQDPVPWPRPIAQGDTE